jgi:hypothetical protein
VGVVRVGRDGRLGAAASLELPPGTLQLSMTQPNILDPVAFRQTLRSVLERAGVPGGGGVILVLPDPVARVALVPGAEARSRGRADTEELLRFRLRKAVPFDIREARVDFVRFGQRAEDALLVAAISRPVLEGYEQACAAVGLHPGIVELAGLSLLGAAFPGGAGGDRLLVNWDDGYVSFLLVREERLELARTLAGELAAAPDEVGRELANTDLYYRERLGGAGFAEIVVRTGALPPPHAARVLREALGVEPRVLDALAAAGRGEQAAVSQALAGAAASALRRAA